MQDLSILPGSPQRCVRQHKRIGDHTQIVVDEVRVAATGQNRDGENLLERVFKLDERDSLPAFDIQDPYTTAAFFDGSFGDGDPTEHCAFPNLRQADEGKSAKEIQTARE